ncbi:acetamidase/formamidase family protein [Roseomonas alkaliterrae]|uniref:Acetamidase/formamidase n=1 Tax=Neoroseomonas alkaliterrae TaxID=1452450 RepID=A0A840XK20_9PROT|nr:acetamidase/formamidase family protein [Neoroseomonas alkaliterrae]MBB5688246.1 acetamidase/formamidase [Neoroseomonas alkaliterrae]MBR0676066.1 acetamidase/formamidase family protein [Neoroseomonas alkaliterrae]
MAEPTRVPASVATCRWGAFDASFPPVASIDPGEVVILECLSGGPEVMPPQEKMMAVPEALREIHAKLPRLGAHIITGPVEVRGAEPGDALRVDIERIELGADWGFCGFRPLFGTLPEDFPYRRTLHIPVDRQAMTCRLPFGPKEGGMDLPLAPFFGVMGVAPPREWGMINTKEPRAIGGNLDNKELTEGATLYLPVFNEGALFSAGDGHGVQGDGEVCINALEMCLTGHFRLSLVKGGGPRDPVLKWPRAETKTHYITMGMHEDLDLAMKQALREMIAFICSRTNLSDADAYQFCSLAVDFRVTQTVNGEKGVHGMLRKGLLF